MLINLHVKNLALIEEADVDFTSHLNILTGETGAGKSVLIGSIQSALGGKIPKDMIRKGADSALIELVFHTVSPAVEEKMRELELPFEDGEIIISRRITSSRVINKVNDTSITLGRLKELAPLLLDLSGQHENQLLLKEQNHLKILDSYGRDIIDPVREEVRKIFSEYTDLQRELASATLDDEARVRELEFLKYEISEIEGASLKEGEDEELEQDYRRISHAREILEECGLVHESLSGSNDCVSDQLGRNIQRLGRVQDLDPDLSGLADRLTGIEDLVSDFCRDLSDYIGSMEFDQETFQEIEDRLDIINHLKSKYGGSIPAILDYWKRSRDRCDQLLHYEDYVSDRKEKLARLEDQLKETCSRLTSLRRETAGPLADSIREALYDLNFQHVQFEISLRPAAHFRADGADDVSFLISVNPGQDPRPLQEIASGGELSRIMLAIKTILADEEEIETLIFDEIDAGISGRTAQKVSEKMALIARSRQVIAITHLPQIASMADAHYLIEKVSGDNSTISNIYPLSDQASVEELARMLGGTKITEAVLENAREMKTLAEHFRSGLGTTE